MICIGLSDVIVEAVQTALAGNGTVTAIRGPSVYDMSYQRSEGSGDKGGRASADATAIITRGDIFPDAIGVSPLACAQKWPILLTGPTTALHASAVQALDELESRKALKVGTYAGLPAGVQGVANLSGSDRYATNRNVASWGKEAAGLSTFPHGTCYRGQVPRRFGSRALPGTRPRHPAPHPALRTLAGVHRRPHHRKPGCDAALLVHRHRRAGAIADQGASAVESRTAPDARHRAVGGRPAGENMYSRGGDDRT